MPLALWPTRSHAPQFVGIVLLSSSIFLFHIGWITPVTPVWSSCAWRSVHLLLLASDTPAHLEFSGICERVHHVSSLTLAVGHCRLNGFLALPLLALYHLWSSHQTLLNRLCKRILSYLSQLKPILLRCVTLVPVSLPHWVLYISSVFGHITQASG